MPRKRFTAEQIIQHLREAEVLLAQGQTIAQVCKKIGITDQTFYRWRKEYGGIAPRCSETSRPASLICAPR